MYFQGCVSANVVKREFKYLRTTDKRLFSIPLTLAVIEQLGNNEALAETASAFVSRFGRLQDTLGDKLLPQLLSYLGELILLNLLFLP